MADEGLHVIIIGGGLAGLVAAISLRQNGHHVEIFEQSRFANEVGAAIQMTPNATGILKQIGVDPQDSGAVPAEKLRLYTAQNVLISTISTEAHRWQNPWLMAHRGHLHSQLKTAATSTTAKSLPVKVHKSSRVLSVEPQSGTLELSNGISHSADVIIGADGVHSITRNRVLPNAPKAFKSRHSAFRFTIQTQEVLDDVETASLADTDNIMNSWYSSSEKIVLYPTANNKILNLVCIHLAVDSESITNDYSTSGSKSKMLEVFKNFHPSLLKLLSKADPAELKIYPIFDMEKLPTYVNGRLALVGDAAHPITPHLAQGGAQALEDAVCLGVLLERGLRPSEVPERLRLYNDIRYARSSKIQEISRIVGGDGLAKDSDNKNKLSVTDYVEYGFSHDEIHSSKQILRQYKWSRNPVQHRALTVFGPAPGARQQDEHCSSVFASPSERPITRRYVVEFKTSATLLREMFPNSRYSFLKNDTIAIASYSIEEFHNLTWVGGDGFKRLAFYIHGVQVRDSNGQARHGSYCPIMLENSANSSLSRREEPYLPILFSDIDVNYSETGCSARISWGGNVYARFSWKGTSVAMEECNSAPVKVPEHSEGVFVHRYLPSLETGRSANENDVLLSQSDVPSSVRLNFEQSSNGTIFKIEDLGMDKLPTLHHIVSRLAELPVFEVLGGTTTMYSGIRDFSAAEVLA